MAIITVYVAGRDGKVLYLLLPLLFLVLLLLLYLPLKVKGVYSRQGGVGKISLWLCVLGINVRLDFGERLFPGGKWKGEGGIGVRQFLDAGGEWGRYIKIAFPHLKRFFSRSEMGIQQLRVEIGTGDAAETGVMVGLLWAGIGLLGPFLKPQAPFKPLIIPIYKGQVLNIYFSGILAVRPVHIISVAVHLLLSLLRAKYTLKGEGTCGGTSNPGLNADGHGKY